MTGSTITLDEKPMSSHAILARVLNRSHQHDSLVGTIAEQVGRDIIAGRLAPGADLNSVELSHQFDTSRTPVREALMLLEKEGLVEIPPRRRPRVARLSIGEVREIYQVRAHLYGLVAELIVANASDEAINSLRPHLQAMQTAARAGDLDAYFWPNVAFQDTETAICGNAVVRRILDSLMLRMLQLRHLSLSQPGRLQESLVDHERLLRAYYERDVALAIALKRGIVLRGLAAIERSGWTGATPRSESGSQDDPATAEWPGDEGT
ncbi:MAG: GntR family transcriptional regulator [Chloroflexi bacterium OHK40]